jgi:hypothetical protein
MGIDLSRIKQGLAKYGGKVWGAADWISNRVGKDLPDASTLSEGKKALIGVGSIAALIGVGALIIKYRK